MNLTGFKIALGTVQFGLSYGIGNKEGQTSEREVMEILSVAKANGVDTLDTAFLYGESESVLGRTAGHDFKIISKFPDVQSADQLYKSLNTSLKRLNVERLYGYMAHRSVSFQHGGVWEALQVLKQSGKVEKIGYSLYHPHELAFLLEQGMEPDIIQVPFNILDQRFASLLEMLHAKGVEIHTRSAFLQGLFFQTPSSLHSFFDPVVPFLESMNHQFTSNAAKANALLRFCVKQHMIDKVVIGVNNASQLTTNLEALNGEQVALQGEMPVVSDSILQPSNWPKL